MSAGLEPWKRSASLEEGGDRARLLGVALIRWQFGSLATGCSMLVRRIVLGRFRFKSQHPPTIPRHPPSGLEKPWVPGLDSVRGEGNDAAARAVVTIPPSGLDLGLGCQGMGPLGFANSGSEGRGCVGG
jgi:hypothetical protein